jgi:hypothetical protein
MLQTLTKEQSHEILKSMFLAAGLLDVTPEEIKRITSEKGWFDKYQYPSVEAQFGHLDWLAKFLVKHGYASKRTGLYEAVKIDCWYGFRQADGFDEAYKKRMKAEKKGKKV